MSLNISLEFRDINNRLIYPVPLRQTPTDVTMAIYRSRDKVQAYLDWLAAVLDDPQDVVEESRRLRGIIAVYDRDYNQIWSVH